MYRYRADVGLGGWEAHLYLRCELRAAGSGVAGATSLITCLSTFFHPSRSPRFSYGRANERLNCARETALNGSLSSEEGEKLGNPPLPHSSPI